MDIQLLEQQLAGFEAKGVELRKNEAVFLKAQGLREQEEKARGEIVQFETDIDGIKEEMDELTSNRNALMDELLYKIRMKMDSVLPVGHSVIDIQDGNLLMGWCIDGPEMRPYKGLSGGETVSFNLALAHALGAGILLVESAELDNDRMADQLTALDKFDGQVVVSTCHAPSKIPEGWKVVELG